MRGAANEGQIWRKRGRQGNRKGRKRKIREKSRRKEGK